MGPALERGWYCGTGIGTRLLLWDRLWPGMNAQRLQPNAQKLRSLASTDECKKL
jgi:hypothetical protein